MEITRISRVCVLLVALSALLAGCGETTISPSVDVSQTLRLLQKDMLSGSVTNADSIFSSSVSVKDTSTGTTETYTRAQMVAVLQMVFSLMKFNSYTFSGETVSVNGKSATIAATLSDAWTSKVDGSKQAQRSKEAFTLTQTGGRWLIGSESYASSPAIPSAPTYNASGYIKDLSGHPVANISILMTDSSGKSVYTGITDSNGHWSGLDLTGAVTITPSSPSWTFSPASSQVSASDPSANFTAAPKLGPAKMTIQSVAINTHVVQSGCYNMPGCSAPVYAYDGSIALQNSGAAGDCKTKIEYDDGAGYWHVLASGYASNLSADGTAGISFNIGDGPEVYSVRVTVYTDEGGSFVQTDQATKAPTN